MAWIDRAAARWLLAATVFAAWCTGSVWALLDATRSYPGIISMKPGRGAFELSQAFLHMPAWQTMGCLFLLAFASMAIVGGLRRLLDPDRMAIDAVFWVLRSKSLWLATAGTILLTVAGLLFRSDWGDDVIGGIEIVACVVMLLTPFLAWNAKTLRRRELSAWWRPVWPGWNAPLLALILIAGGLAADAAFFFGIFDAGWMTGPWVVVLRTCLGEIASFLAGLLIALAWIGRATIPAGWRSFLMFLRWRRLRANLWQTLLLALVGVGVVIPILMATILLVYVVPQYEELAKSGGIPLSWFLRTIAQLARQPSAWWLPLAAIGGLWTSLAGGRLLVSLGAGVHPAPGLPERAGIIAIPGRERT